MTTLEAQSRFIEPGIGHLVAPYGARDDTTCDAGHASSARTPSECRWSAAPESAVRTSGRVGERDALDALLSDFGT
jgi:hypothetical protein